MGDDGADTMMSFQTLPELCRSSIVCLKWNSAASADRVWADLADHHGWDATKARKRYRRYACFNLKVTCTCILPSLRLSSDVFVCLPLRHQRFATSKFGFARR